MWIVLSCIPFVIAALYFPILWLIVIVPIALVGIGTLVIRWKRERMVQASDPTPTKMEAAIEGMSTPITIQLGLANATLAEIFARDDIYALGYVSGYQALVCQYFELSKEDAVVAICASLLRLCKDPTLAGTLFRRCEDLIGDPTFKHGANVGMADSLGFVDEQKAPLGLADFLLRKDKPDDFLSAFGD